MWLETAKRKAYLKSQVVYHLQKENGTQHF